MAKHIVGTVDEIPPGGRKIVTLEGREIGIFNLAGEFFALLNRCPHQGGPLCKGRLSGFVTAPSPGDYRLTRPGEVLRCPWHGWEFDIRNGQSWFDPVRTRVRSYQVTVEPGSAILGAGEGAGGSNEGAEAGTEARVGAAVESVVDSASDTSDTGETEPGMEGLVKGPYVAETFPVSIDRKYVIVEVGGPR